MRLFLKCKIVLNNVPSSRTGVDSKWIEELQQEKAIWNLKCESCFAGKTTTENLADRIAQKQQQT